MRAEHDGQYAAVASKGGAPEHPTSYHNLVAEPLVELQDGPVRRDTRARIVTGEERTAWWERADAAFPHHADHQRKTDREDSGLRALVRRNEPRAARSAAQVHEDRNLRGRPAVDSELGAPATPPRCAHGRARRCVGVRLTG